MFDEVPGKPYGVAHVLRADDQRLPLVKEFIVTVNGCPAEQTGDMVGIADQLSRPVHDVRILVLEPGFQFLRKCLDHPVGFLGKGDALRLFRVFLLQHVPDPRLVSAIDFIGNRLRPVPSPAHEGCGHGIQESGRQAASPECLVLHQPGQDAGLYHQEHGQRGMHDTFAGPPDTVYPNGIAGEAFEENVDIDILRVDTGQRIEDAALG